MVRRPKEKRVKTIPLTVEARILVFHKTLNQSVSARWLCDRTYNVVAVFNIPYTYTKVTNLYPLLLYYADDEEIDDKRKVCCVEDIAVLEKYFTELKSR